MDDSPYLHYQVSYGLEFMQPPKIGETVRAKIVAVQKNYITLTIGQLFTIIVPVADVNKDRFEIEEIPILAKKGGADQDKGGDADEESNIAGSNEDQEMTEENLDVPDPEVDELSGESDENEEVKGERVKGYEYKIRYLKKNKVCEAGSKVKV
eukprot:CAMPEP_0168622976 /NCGR_PEP_ID=MMETSP0449_2-20121227/8570_1 /TAXON_ID=1082188 /ORGANISM="Strombidium rassoulzadegani, Strain ras09" /LENGTH=152 /DNA_ID=CAMNT_0008664309 /DNA_START=164 /DNA_END=619 /DNA_ORIENTATION=+